jgi:energy-coupling factor transporter ATP-binding protein EcfA2
MFHKAIKTESKLRLAIAGPSGSGKTYTALAIGTALASGGRVAVVDTEHGSASKYADIFDFDVAEMHEPFSPAKYVKAIAGAAEAGYDVVILDSTSHAWNGTGGVLEIVEQAGKRARGNTYVGWAEGTPAQNSLIEAITGAGIHVIATMRSKQDYIMVEKNGKQVPQKVGMAPVQRDGFEYEFDVLIDMDIDNNGIVSKTRCPALTGKVFSKPGQDVAGILSEWLGGEGAPADNESLPESLADAPEDAAAHLATPPASKPKPTKATNGNGELPLFKNVQQAREYGVESGAYRDLAAASDAYVELKAKINPGSAGEMWAAWIEHCKTATA